MVYVSLLINIAVLVPVCITILRNGPAAQQTFGPKTPARDILCAAYLAILILSGVALVCAPQLDITAAVLTLFAFQVLYKALTVLTLGLPHPVVVTNVFIALFHSATIALTLTVP